MMIIMVGLPYRGQEVSQVSTEPEVRWWMVHMYPGEVERVESYHCEIPDAMHVTQTIFIGLYLATTGELQWLCCRR